MMTLNVDPITLASILLGMRIVALILIGAVLTRQIRNLRRLQTEFPAVRWSIFILTVVLFLGQFIPILLDASVALLGGSGGRSANPSLLGASYAINNATKDVIIGVLLCFIYFRPGATRPRKR